MWSHLERLVRGHCRKVDYEKMKSLSEKQLAKQKKAQDKNSATGSYTDPDFYL